MVEQKIQAKILNTLKKRAYCVKVMAANKNGVPDILACYKGRFVAIEVKTNTGRPTALQLANIDLIKENGGYAIIARSEEEVLELLERIDNETIQTPNNSS